MLWGGVSYGTPLLVYFAQMHVRKLAVFFFVLLFTNNTTAKPRLAENEPVWQAD